MIRYLIIIIMAALSVVPTMAQSESADSTQAIDTIYVYRDWNSVLNATPVTAYSGPIVYRNNELEYEVFTCEEQSQQVIDRQAIAICLGDSLWLANADYLNRYFNNKREWFMNYLPLYFTDKIAFVKFWNGYPEEYYLRAMPNKAVRSVFIYNCESSFFILDFMGRQMVELDHKVLASLLLRYPDLLTRYMGMKKYKTREVVDFFFLQYIERLKTDDEALTITEQLNQSRK